MEKTVAVNKDGNIDATILNEVKGIRAPLDQARHLPSYFYTSPEIFEIEKERLFYKDWLCVGREEEIANPGDYFTLRICDEPVVVCRNKEGAVAAFSNTCAHRGVEVAEGRGNRSVFVCPYHAWSYDLDGKLIGAAHMGNAEGFDVAKCRLPQLGVGRWGGWIFVSLADDPIPFDKFIARFDQEFSFLRVGDCRLAARITFDLDCNWKFVVENLFDVYHARVVHAKSFGKYRDSVDYFPTARGQESTIGYYNSASLVPGGKSLFGNMPWLADKPPTFACLGHLPPNLQLFARCDNVVTDVIWPVAPDKTRLLLHILFPKEVFDRPDFEEKLKIYRDFQVQVIEEDRALVNSLQQGAKSKKFQPGRMSFLEHGVYNVINYQIDRIYGDLKGSV